MSRVILLSILIGVAAAGCSAGREPGPLNAYPSALDYLNEEQILVTITFHNMGASPIRQIDSVLNVWARGFTGLEGGDSGGIAYTNRWGDGLPNKLLNDTEIIGPGETRGVTVSVRLGTYIEHRDGSFEVSVRSHYIDTKGYWDESRCEAFDAQFNNITREQCHLRMFDWPGK